MAISTINLFHATGLHNFICPSFARGELVIFSKSAEKKGCVKNFDVKWGEGSLKGVGDFSKGTGTFLNFLITLLPRKLSLSNLVSVDLISV